MRPGSRLKALVLICGLMLPNNCSRPEKGRIFKDRHKPRPDVATCALSNDALEVTYQNEKGTYHFSSGDGIRKEFDPRILLCELSNPIVIFNPETNALLILPSVGELIVSTNANMPISIERVSLDGK